MAESTQVEYINDNGDTVRVELPKYAMDSTMQDILRVFKDQLNANNNAIKKRDLNSVTFCSIAKYKQIIKRQTEDSIKYLL